MSVYHDLPKKKEEKVEENFNTETTFTVPMDELCSLRAKSCSNSTNSQIEIHLNRTAK